MTVPSGILMRMFGRPEGLPGRIGGAVMARMNRPIAHSVIARLQIRPTDRILEAGFGPGVAIERLAELAPEGRVAGVDVSRQMLELATLRNTEAIQRRRVTLHQCSVEAMPFDDAEFDVALAINSMQVWPDTRAGLLEIKRVLRPGGRIALGFTPRAVQSQRGVADALAEAGFAGTALTELDEGFCAMAQKA